MKVLYSSLGGSLKGSSVQDKIACQVRELNQNGLETDGWLFTASVAADTKLDSGLTLKPLKLYESNRRWFRGYYENQFYYRQMQHILHEAPHDLIFYRHSGTGWSYIKMLESIRKKCLLYIPSYSIAENYNEKKYSAKVGPVSTFLRWFEYFIYFYLPERYLYNRTSSRLRGIVAFTPEFASIIKRKSGGKAKVYFNRDGADCKRIRKRNHDKQIHDEYCRLVFMKGSSMLQPWSGLDRLIKSIDAQPAHKIKLYITGNVTEPERYNYPFIEITGRLSHEELENLIDTVDLGVSNLANYMIHFNETTNLKSRDYFARGLPFIQANTMPDIDGTEAEKYYLNLPNTDEIIHMDEVVRFAMERREDLQTADNMRAFAEMNLDWSITVKELAQVIKESRESAA